MDREKPLNREEFNNLYLDALPMLYNLALRIFRNNTEEALDFLQEFYIYAESKKGTFLGKSRFSTWLYRMALNKAIELIKKQKKIHFTELPTEILDARDTNSSNPPFYDQDLEKKIQEEFQKLPDTYRLPLYLRFYEKLSYQEIANKLQIKEGTLKSLLNRGKKILKNKLQKRGGYEVLR